MISLRALVLLLSAAGAYGQCKTIAPDAQDGPIASPENHDVLYEDADVRVLDVHSQPHTREAWHTHARPAVMYVDSQGAGKYMQPGKPDSKVRPKDDPSFTFRIFATEGNEGLHATENTGNVPFHAIRVEFKHPGCSLDPNARSAKPGSAATKLESDPVLFENDDVRVLEVTVPPRTQQTFHVHAWPGFAYVPRTDPAKETAGGAKEVWAWTIRPISADEPYVTENLRDTAIHGIFFELKHATPK